MRQFIEELKDFWKKGDMVLLILCLIVSGFGLVCITSATSADKFGSNLSYIAIQTLSIGLGVMCYALVSSLDLDLLSEHRGAMVVFNSFLLLLLIPFGVNRGGNRSWLDLPLIPMMVQPAEICKITYIIIMASVMSSHQNTISHPFSVIHMGLHLAALVGLNLILSSDMGVSLIFVFIFIGMVFTGGISWWWVLAGIGGVAAGAPILWNILPEDNYMKTRIAVLFDPSLDPNGIGPMYQTVRALRSLTGGGLTGQGLFDGNRTQTNGALFAQHTDFIYSAIGEELGFMGCAAVLILLFLIIFRCFWVGIRSQDTLRRLVCFGVASALIFQVIINVGMNIGVMPVIGLTLPFISYGGSSIITLYVMVGLVSGVYAHPSATSHERYIHPPIKTIM